MPTIQQCAQLIQSGQIAPAIQNLKQILAANAKEFEAHHLIGVAYIYGKDYKLAEKHLLKCLKLVPQHIEAQYNLARLYTELNKISKAKMLLIGVLKARPDWLQARFALALAAVGLKEPKLAMESFEAVLQQHPENFEALGNIGNLHFEAKEFALAKASYQQALQINPNYEEAVVGLAESMLALEELQELVVKLESYAQDLNSNSLYVKLASAYRLLGDKQKAKHFADIAIKNGDQSGDAHKIFFDSSKIEAVEDLADLQAAIDKEGLADSAKIKMQFAMNKGLEACGMHEQALEHLDSANGLRRKEFSYSTAESVKLFDMLKKAYSAKRLESFNNESGLGEGIIFILGMPRSGTSLVEQIVSSHSSVLGAGELQLLRDIWKSTKANTEAKFHMQLLDKNSHDIEIIAQNYVEAVTKLKGNAAVLTDKMPHNFLMIGFIAAALPKAKIVHCKRHPIANCLSIYKADFRTTHGYAFNQKELAEYHNLYEELMQYWREVLPGKFYEIKYEDLTSNQEEETRKLIEYCGLEWEDACLDFHKNKRAVKTASAYQVRQKMHNKSIDLWKRYGDGLQPLIDNLYIPPEYQD